MDNKLCEFKFDNFKIEPSFIADSILEKYDIVKLNAKVEEKINDYISYEFKYPMIKRHVLTQSYEVRYECFVPRKVDKTGKYIEEKLTFEENIARLYSDIVAGLSNMNKMEFNYFIHCLYQKKSANSFRIEYDINRPKFDKVKNSCIVKLALALNLD